MNINFGARSVSCKIVYYGPGLSGKTTNIQKVHELTPGDRKGELTSIKTEGDRTLFFDFMSIDLGKVAGMDTRFQLYTVPGQVYYNATRKLVLQGADGVVFVADSSPGHMQENLDSWNNLHENLAERGLDLKDLSLVMQWNKRDVPGAASVDEMNRLLNAAGAPAFEAVACNGDGVLQTLKSVCSLVCRRLNARRFRSASVEKTPEPAVAAAAVAEPTVQAGEMSFASRRMSAARPAASAVAVCESAPSATTVATPVMEAPSAPPVSSAKPAATVVVREEPPAPPKSQRVYREPVVEPAGMSVAWKTILLLGAAVATAAVILAAMHFGLGIL